MSLAVIVAGAGLWASAGTTAAAKNAPPPTFPLTSEVVVVPDLQGENAYVAFAALAKVHLNIKAILRESPSGQGHVIGQSPAAGTKVRGGAVVSVIVGTGPKP